MNYLIFKGVSTQSIPGVVVAQMPAHKRPAMRYTEFYVKGRDGALHINEGYSNIELKVKLQLIDARAEMRYAVNSWASGFGRLISSDDPSKAWKAQVLREGTWTRVQGNKGFFDYVMIYFDASPFLYEAVDSQFVFTGAGSLKNPGTEPGIPMIKVEGSGNATFTVSGTTVTIKGMTSGVPVYIDCENGYIRSSSNSPMEMIGDYPEIPTGNSSVSLGSGTTKLTITPHWRWV